MFIISVPAGFPSPGADYAEGPLDLNDYLIKHPAATFFVRVIGDSMVGTGIYPNDLLIVDRALDATNGSVVIAVVNGDLTIKRLHESNGRVVLLSENPAYPPLEIDHSMTFGVWGVRMSSSWPICRGRCGRRCSGRPWRSLAWA